MLAPSKSDCYHYLATDNGDDNGNENCHATTTMSMMPTVMMTMPGSCTMTPRRHNEDDDDCDDEDDGGDDFTDDADANRPGTKWRGETQGHGA